MKHDQQVMQDEEGEIWSGISKTYPSLDDIMKLGENANGAYGYAFLYIFPSVYGWVHHKLNWERTLQSKMFNATDEALALILLENSYEMWKSGCKSSNAPALEPKYTVRFVKRRGEGSYDGDDVKDGKSASRAKGYGGWSYVGIQRYMEILTAVQVDRKSKRRKDLEIIFLRKTQEARRNAVAGRRQKKKVNTGVISRVEEMMNEETMWQNLIAVDDVEDDSEKRYMESITRLSV